MKRFLIAFTFLFLLFPQTGLSQEKPVSEDDSVTVSVEALRNLKHEHKVLQRKVALQDTIIQEQEYQIQLYQKRLKQDSTLNVLNKKQLSIRNERIELRDDRIESLENRNTWLRVGAAAGIVLGFVLGSK